MAEEEGRGEKGARPKAQLGESLEGVEVVFGAHQDHEDLRVGMAWGSGVDSDGDVRGTPAKEGIRANETMGQSPTDGR